MQCKHNFEMTAKQIDPGIIIYRCPWGCKKTIMSDRPSATKPPRTRHEFLSGLEQKA